MIKRVSKRYNAGWCVELELSSSVVSTYSFGDAADADRFCSTAMALMYMARAGVEVR